MINQNIEGIHITLTPADIEPAMLPLEIGLVLFTLMQLWTVIKFGRNVIRRRAVWDNY